MKKSIRNLQSSFPNSFFYLILITLFLNFSTMTAQNKDMMVCIAEIEIEPSFLQEYLDILNEESSESVKLEPGVISIFPMFQKENHYLIRILEIYADKSAYEAHLKTEHFLKYKNSTLKMVKSLKLIDMNASDSITMKEIFKKI
jgi:quinol monooxygenase YgiN